MLIFGRQVLRKVLVVFVSVTFFANLFAQKEHPSMEPAFSLFGVLGVKSEAGNTNYTADEVSTIWQKLYSKENPLGTAKANIKRTIF